MSALRMIKMFGWESRVSERIAEKREDELQWIWKRELLHLGTSILKYVPTLYISDQTPHHFFSFLIPLAHMIATYAVYVSLLSLLIRATADCLVKTTVMKRELTGKTTLLAGNVKTENNHTMPHYSIYCLLLNDGLRYVTGRCLPDHIQASGYNNRCVAKADHPYSS